MGHVSIVGRVRSLGRAAQSYDYRFSLPIATLIATLTACSSAGRLPSGAERPIEILTPTEAVTLDPRFATRALDVRLTRLIHSGLVTLSPDTLEPVLSVAQSITREGPLALSIELKNHVHFHGGKPLGAEDVCATLGALRSARLHSPHRNIVEAFVSCVVRGPKTLSLSMAEPRATFRSDLEIPILRADQAQLSEQAGGSLDGLGPYRVLSRSHQAILLVPTSPTDKTSSRPSISVRTIQDENVRAMRILSGKAEIAPNAFSPTILAGLRTHETRVRSRPGANVTYLLANNERAPFDRVKYRQALSRAVDRDLITRHLLASFAKEARWLLPQEHWASPTHLQKLPFDPASARGVFAGLGEVELLTSTDRSRILQARAIAQMLRDAGLRTKVVPLELGLLLSRLDGGQYALAMLQIPELTEPNVLGWFFHPRGIDSPSEGRNRARYRSATAARLLDAASMEMSREKRRLLYFDLAKVMLEDMPVVPLWHEDQIVVVRDRAWNFLPSAEGRWGALTEL